MMIFYENFKNHFKRNIKSIYPYIIYIYLILILIYRTKELYKKARSKNEDINKAFLTSYTLKDLTSSDSEDLPSPLKNQPNKKLIIDLNNPTKKTAFNNPRPKPKEESLFKELFPIKRIDTLKKTRENEISSYIKLTLEDDKVSGFISLYIYIYIFIFILILIKLRLIYLLGGL
jgi:hypothetical protein